LPVDGTFASVDETPQEGTTDQETPNAAVDTTSEPDSTGETPEGAGTDRIEPAATIAPEESVEPSPTEGTVDEETPTQGPDDQVIVPSDGSNGNGDIAGAEDETPDAEQGSPGEPGTGTVSAGNDQEPGEASGGDNQRSGLGGRGNAAVNLADVAVSSDYGSFDGDTSGRLALDSNNNLVLTGNPDFASLTRDDGLSLDVGTTDSGDQGVQVCNQNGDCTVHAASQETDEGSRQVSNSAGTTDTPIGWLGDTVMYERIDGNSVSFRAFDLDPDSLEQSNDRELLSGDRGVESTRNGAYYGRGGLLVPGAEQWVFLSLDGNSQVLGANPYTDISLVRTDHPSGAITYVGNGQLIVADMGDPGNARATVSFQGTDYDLAPGGDLLAISTGSGIQIVDFSGQVLAEYTGGGQIQVGSVLWLNAGVAFIDASSGEVLLIPNEALP
jgi:hypothetical protein